MITFMKLAPTVDAKPVCVVVALAHMVDATPVRVVVALARQCYACVCVSLLHLHTGLTSYGRKRLISYIYISDIFIA